MDFQSLSAVITEASGLLTGGRVDRVYESVTGDIVLMLRNSGRQFILLLSADRSLPRIHLLSRKPAARSSVSPFTLYLRSRLTGGRLETIEILNSDRIVEMRFNSRGRILRLLAELFGSSANLIITNGENLIQTVYYPVSGGGHGDRLLAGIAYTLPERRGAHATPQPRETASGRGMPDHASSSPNLEAERSFLALRQQRTFEARKAKLLAAGSKLLMRINRRLESLDHDRGRCERAEEYRQSGDIILMNLKSLRTGMKEAHLPAPDGTVKTVQLDPASPPQENAERYYKQYKKAKAGRIVIAARTAESRTERCSVEALLNCLQKVSSEKELSLLEAESGNTIPALAGRERRAPSPAAPPDPFRKILFQGWEILVGRNARGNDHITCKIARGMDLWLHAEGMPGSHVLIRNPQSAEIPPDVLERAASLAAYYSRGRLAGKVPVSYTFARFVRKPNGAKPGLVTLSERKSIMAAPQSEGNDAR